MELKDLKMSPAKLKLKAFPRELTLNPITLADEVWLAETFGEDGVTQIFQTVNIKEIARIVFRLLDIEDKKLLKKKSVTFISEDGEELECSLGGVELLYHSIVGMDEKVALLNAIVDLLNLSRPTVDEKEAPKKPRAQKKKATK